MEKDHNFRNIQRQREKDKYKEEYELFSKSLSSKDPSNKRQADFSSSVWEEELRPFFSDVVNTIPKNIKADIAVKLKHIGSEIENIDEKKRYKKAIVEFLKANVELLVFLTVKTTLDLCITKKSRSKHISLQNGIDKIKKEILKHLLFSQELRIIIGTARPDDSEGIDKKKDNVLKTLNLDLVHISGYFLDCVIENQNIITRGKDQKHRGMYTLDLSPEIAKYYDPNVGARNLFKPSKVPMICEPERWDSSLQGGGYLTQKESFLVNVKSRKHREIILKNLENVKTKKLFLNAVNLLQKTPWVINRQILEVVKSLQNCEELKYDAHEKNFLCGQTSFLAKEYKDFKLYFPWYLDFRGRMYTSVTQISPQAHEGGRALLLFAEEQSINKKNEQPTLENLYIYGYNKYSPTSRKKSKNEMITWVDSNINEIIKSAKNPHSNLDFWLNASDKYCFLAFCFEISKIKTTNYLHRTTQLPVYIDGTCNGFQHYSALLRDEKVAPFVNLVDSEVPGDFYQEVANNLRESLMKSASEDEVLKEVMLRYVDRSFVKKSVISAGYGAGLDTRTEVTANNLYEALMEDANKNSDLENLVSSCKNSAEIADSAIFTISKEIESLLSGSISKLCPSFSKVKRWLGKVSKVISSKGECIGWESPSGFPVSNYYYDFPHIEIKLYIGKTPKKILFKDMESTKNISIDKNQIQSSMAPNFIHSLDASHAAFIITNFFQTKSEQESNSIASIHDSFATHATHIDELHKIIRQTFFNIYSENQLLKFKNQIEERYSVAVPEVPPLGKLDISLALNSKYLFY